MTAHALNYMRYRAVSDGGHIDGGWLAAAAAVASAALTGAGLWIGQRLIGKAAWDEMLTKRMSVFMEGLERAHVRDEATLKRLTEELEAERAAGRVRDAELGAAREEIGSLRGLVNNLRQSNASLRDSLDRAGLTSGITTPDVVHDRPLAGLIELPPTGSNDA